MPPKAAPAFGRRRRRGRADEPIARSAPLDDRAALAGIVDTIAAANILLGSCTWPARICLKSLNRPKG
jgi:hypothetical protein